MRHFLIPPDRIVVGSLNCPVCGFKTDHIFNFISYNPKFKMVTYSFYCADCYNRYGDEVMAEQDTKPAELWIKFVSGLDENRIEDN